jgi:hypothetical protein
VGSLSDETGGGGPSARGGAMNRPPELGGNGAPGGLNSTRSSPM